jgi:hypothetical protein
MAFEYVVAPAIARYGDSVIPEIVRGMEELQVLTSLADADFVAQLAFADTVEDLKARAGPSREQIPDGHFQGPATKHVEDRSQSLITCVYDHDKLYAVESGALDLVIGHDHSVRLEHGESIIVPRQRLHGTAVASESCRYFTYDLQDQQTCE